MDKPMIPIGSRVRILESAWYSQKFEGEVTACDLGTEELYDVRGETTSQSVFFKDLEVLEFADA